MGMPAAARRRHARGPDEPRLLRLAKRCALAKRYEDFMPSNADDEVRALSDAQVTQFIEDGFVRLDRAFPRHLADEGRAMLWRDTGCDPADRITWTKAGDPARLLRRGTVPHGCEHAHTSCRFRPACRTRPLAPAAEPRQLSGAFPAPGRSRGCRLARRCQLSRRVR